MSPSSSISVWLRVDSFARSIALKVSWCALAMLAQLFRFVSRYSFTAFHHCIAGSSRLTGRLLPKTERPQKTIPRPLRPRRQPGPTCRARPVLRRTVLPSLAWATSPWLMFSYPPGLRRNGPAFAAGGPSFVRSDTIRLLSMPSAPRAGTAATQDPTGDPRCPSTRLPRRCSAHDRARPPARSLRWGCRPPPGWPARRSDSPCSTGLLRRARWPPRRGPCHRAEHAARR
jgi:hypothetical protein